MSRVAVIGLGKLGAPLAAVLSSKGHTVVGVDLNVVAISKINARQAPVEETGLDDLLRRYPFQATTSHEEAVKKTDTAFVIVPTPSMDDGSFSNHYVLEAMRMLGAALKGRRRYYNVVICSTVMPGSTASHIKNALEDSSERTVGDTLGLLYSPEFIALGSVIENILHPDMVLIGESDEKAGKKLTRLIRTITDAPIRRMSLASAEIAKISVNAYVTMKISFANVLGELCEHTEDADAHVIANAMGLDIRIGRKYLSPGAPYGGPCFPRDSRAFARLALQRKGRPDLALATEAVNDYQLDRFTQIVKTFDTNNVVGVLGLTYKTDTTVVEESFGIKLSERLTAEGLQVYEHDPSSKARSQNLEHIIGYSSVIVIATPWEDYRGLVPKCFERNPQLVVVDCWDICPRGPWDELHVYRIGIG